MRKALRPRIMHNLRLESVTIIISERVRFIFMKNTFGFFASVCRHGLFLPHEYAPHPKTPQKSAKVIDI